MASADGNLLFSAVAVAAALAAAFYGVAAVFDWSDERIAANERARVAARLNSVLEPALRGRDLTTTLIAARDELLGSDDPIDVFVLTERDIPAAVVFAPVAPHGYNAAINLLVGISPAGAVTGVRVVRHRETQGLGDAIDVAKSNWMLQFDAKSLVAPAPALWAIRQDDGDFDAISGATVTSRAVVGTVKNTLLYFERHRDELYTRAAEEAAADADDP